MEHKRGTRAGNGELGLPITLRVGGGREGEAEGQREQTRTQIHMDIHLNIHVYTAIQRRTHIHAHGRTHTPVGAAQIFPREFVNM